MLLPLAIDQPGPQLVVTGAVLLSAVLHASWNALAKALPDQLVAFVLIDLAALSPGLLLVWFVPAPDPAAWAFIGFSAALHVVYKSLLIGSYQVGDLSHVYPLARGSAPLLVAVGAALVGERLGPAQLSGVLVVSAGLLLLTGYRRRSPGRRSGTGDAPAPAEATRSATRASRRYLTVARAERATVVLALATGVSIAIYTVVDGLGVRRSGTVLGYVIWLSVLDSLPIPLYAVARYGRRVRGALRASRAALAGGVVAVVAYGLVLWAQTRGTLAAVAALRESGVIVAAMIGTAFFNEPFGRRRIAAAIAIAAGIVLINI